MKHETVFNTFFLNDDRSALSIMLFGTWSHSFIYDDTEQGKEKILRAVKGLILQELFNVGDSKGAGCMQMVALKGELL